MIWPIWPRSGGILVELQLRALRRFEHDRVARRRGRLLPRRGKDQQRKMREIDPAVVVTLVVVEHDITEPVSFSITFGGRSATSGPAENSSPAAADTC